MSSWKNHRKSKYRSPIQVFRYRTWRNDRRGWLEREEREEKGKRKGRWKVDRRREKYGIRERKVRTWRDRQWEEASEKDRIKWGEREKEKKTYGRWERDIREREREMWIKRRKMKEEANENYEKENDFFKKKRSARM